MYTEVLAEDIGLKHLVLTMRATDRDEPGTPNSKIIYSLEGEGAGDFDIHPTRGIGLKSRF